MLMHLRLVHSVAAPSSPSCDTLRQSWAGRPLALVDPTNSISSPGGQGREARCAASTTPRPLLDRDTVIKRLTDWAERARCSGRTRRADELLLLAWQAYDRPARVLN